MSMMPVMKRGRRNDDPRLKATRAVKTNAAAKSAKTPIPTRRRIRLAPFLHRMRPPGGRPADLNVGWASPGR